MPSRPAHLGLSFALALTLMSGASWAQQINRGPMHVVGLRAPDGDSDVAGGLTTGLREAARGAGYQVPDGTPNFEQEFAMVGCTAANPECMSSIASDIHAPKFIYGTVSRIGRGRDAQLSIEVSLWDETTHREIHREATTMPRAQSRSPEAVRALAQQLFVAVGNRDMAAQQEVLRTQQEEAARRAEQERLAQQNQQLAQQNQQAQQQLARRTTIQRSHVLRYVGLGVLGLGVVAGAVGVVQWVRSSGMQSDATNGQGEEGAGWTRFDNAINQPNASGVRPLSVSDVCDRAASNTDASLAADAARAQSICSSNSTARTMAYVFGLGGVVIAGVGAALIVIDSLNSSSGAAPASPNGATPPRRAQMQVTPVLSPGYGGVNLGLTF